MSLRKCSLIKKLLCHVATETIELPIYEGLPELSEFLVEFEYKMSKSQWLLALEEALKANPIRWWDTHKKSITGWSYYRRIVAVHFGDVEVCHDVTLKICHQHVIGSLTQDIFPQIPKLK